MYDKKITYMPTDRYRHLAFQISAFFKQSGYINIADLLTELRNDVDSVKTIGELETLNLKEEVDIEEIEDYLGNIRSYNEELQKKRYKQELEKEKASSDDLKVKQDLGNKLIAAKMRSEDDD